MKKSLFFLTVFISIFITSANTSEDDCFDSGVKPLKTLFSIIEFHIGLGVERYKNRIFLRTAAGQNQAKADSLYKDFYDKSKNLEKEEMRELYKAEHDFMLILIESLKNSKIVNFCEDKSEKESFKLSFECEKFSLQKFVFFRQDASLSWVDFLEFKDETFAQEKEIPLAKAIGLNNEREETLRQEFEEKTFPVIKKRLMEKISAVAPGLTDSICLDFSEAKLWKIELVCPVDPVQIESLARDEELKKTTDFSVF